CGCLRLPRVWIRRSGRAAVRGIRFSELRNLPVLRNGIWLRRRNRGARGSAEGVGRQRNALVEWQRRPTEWLGSTGPVAQVGYAVAAPISSGALRHPAT